MEGRGRAPGKAPVLLRKMEASRRKGEGTRGQGCPVEVQAGVQVGTQGSMSWRTGGGGGIVPLSLLLVTCEDKRLSQWFSGQQASESPGGLRNWIAGPDAWMS